MSSGQHGSTAAAKSKDFIITTNTSIDYNKDWVTHSCNLFVSQSSLNTCGGLRNR